MSQGKKAKVVMAQKTMKDPELIDMFNKMVGASDPDPNIVLPKYNKIYQKTMEVIELLLKFSGSPIMKVFSPQFPKGFLELRQFAQSSIDELKQMELESNDNILSGEELYAINSNPQKMAEFLANINNRFKVAGLSDKYRALREHPVVKEIIMIARNLKNVVIPEKERMQSETHDLEIKESLRDGFILNSEGDHLTLFNFTSLDFKQMWYSDLMNEKYRNYILQVLHYIYVRVIDVVREITSPDIDVDKFSEILVKNINEMRKNIPRCDKAFDKIQSSVGLLKGNFGEYYKDFVTSQNTNPGVIVENFIFDVANKNKADIQTTRQFKQIIDFYRQKMSGRKIDDPKVKKMLSLAGQNISILEDKLDKKKPPTNDE